MQVLSELEARSKQVAFEASALTTARQQLAALDAQRRAAALAVEEMLGAKGAALDDRAKEQRLRQIRAVEEAYQVNAGWGPPQSLSAWGHVQDHGIEGWVCSTSLFL